MSPLHRGPEKTPPEQLRQRRILWICVLGWTALVAFALWWLFKDNGGLSVWVFHERDMDQPGFSQKVHALFSSDLGLQRVYPWILFGPYLVLMAWYFPLERERLYRNLPLNAAACVAFVWACHALDRQTALRRPNLVVLNADRDAAPGTPPLGTNGFLVMRGPLPPNFKHTPSRKALLRSTIVDLLAYGAVTALVHSINFYLRFRERERRALLLESNLANVRLNTLKAQLQPHFLFNSLNAIAALLRRDPRLAETTLVALSELLRVTLSQSERQEGALREELEFVRRYLEIQQTRFGDKLRVEENIEAQALECMVPTLVLQPLVENAIRHGIEPAEKAGMVRVSAARKAGNLVLTVEDDGVGLDSGKVDSRSSDNSVELRPDFQAANRNAVMKGALSREGTGIGLSNLRERLQALYGIHQKVELTPRPTGGVIVHVEIPWHTEAASEF
jgi:anti-sigma regulatory factor (Ser/Thr protein kinase)